MGLLTDIQDTEIVEFIARGIESAACCSTRVLWENELECGRCGSCSVCDTTYIELGLRFHADGKRAARAAARDALQAVLEEVGVGSVADLVENRNGESARDLARDEFWHEFGMCLWYTRERSGSGVFDDPDKWAVVGGEDVCRFVGKCLTVSSDDDLWPAVRALADGNFEVIC